MRRISLDRFAWTPLIPRDKRGPMLKSKSSALLSLVLVFLSGTLVGSVTYRLYMVNSVNSGGAQPGRGQGKMDPEEVRKRRVAAMQGKGKVDADQVAQANGIYDGTPQQLQAP